MAREANLARESFDKPADDVDTRRFEIEARTGRHSPTRVIDAMRQEPALICHAIRTELAAIGVGLRHPVAERHKRWRVVRNAIAIKPYMYAKSREFWLQHDRLCASPIARFIDRCNQHRFRHFDTAISSKRQEAPFAVHLAHFAEVVRDDSDV